MLSADQVKEKLGYAAAQLVRDGMTIGAGTGSTAFWFIQALGEQVRKGLQCRAVPTSSQTTKLLDIQKIPVIKLNDVSRLDLVVDGADEIDYDLQLIKGGGGALLQEKMVAFAADRYVIIADQGKLVNRLGKFPLPLEVIPFGYRQVQQCIQKEYGIPASLRIQNDKPFNTDNNNYILDIPYLEIGQPAAVHSYLKNIPGVVEVGLFLNMAHEVIIGYNSGELKYFKAKTH